MNTSATARKPGSLTGLLRGVAHLSVGTIVLQALGALGQVVFAIWLSPEDFGMWAATSSSLLLFTGLINFGEVNGFLADPARTYRQTLRAIWACNSLLMLGAVAVASSYAIAGYPRTTLLVLLIAANLPLLGQANLLYAAYVKQRLQRQLVWGMVGSAVARLAVGTLAAWLFRSPVAFAVSMLAYSVSMIVVLGRRSVEEQRAAKAPSANRPWRIRSAQAAQSLSQIIPTQIDFLVVSLIASPALLGIYFLSYQATVAVSALVVGALSKSFLSSLAGIAAEHRQGFGAQLMNVMVAIIGIGVCLATGILHLCAGHLPLNWQTAAPTIAILLTSLPSRFLTPVSDSLQMAAGRWWNSTRLNLIDAMGTATVSIAALAGEVTLLALAIAAWKICYAAVRVWSSLPNVNTGARLILVGWPLVLAVVLTSAVFVPGALSWLPIAGGLALCLVRLYRLTDRRPDGVRGRA